MPFSVQVTQQASATDGGTDFAGFRTARDGSIEQPGEEAWARARAFMAQFEEVHLPPHLHRINLVFSSEGRTARLDHSSIVRRRTRSECRARGQASQTCVYHFDAEPASFGLVLSSP